MHQAKAREGGVIMSQKKAPQSPNGTSFSEKKGRRPRMKKAPFPGAASHVREERPCQGSMVDFTAPAVQGAVALVRLIKDSRLLVGP